ncbi:MAG: class I SAM-dependent methyltransferase [Candidatus Nomurabacteria bacterium]|nr:class I SAM-dependent methyltransferase [Candidatus Nomurabacteria bacterium]
MAVHFIFICVLVVIVLVFLVTALFGAPYVPSGEREVFEVFRRLHKLTDEDVVVDFGCGDGKVLRVAMASGAKEAVGMELNPILAALARLKSRRDGWIKIRCGNMLRMKLPEDMTVAYVFGVGWVMRALKPRLEEFANAQGRTVFVVSKAFEFDGVKAVKKWGGFFLYTIKPSEGGQSPLKKKML